MRDLEKTEPIKVPLRDRDRHVLNVVVEIAKYGQSAPASLPVVAAETGYNISYLEKQAARFRDYGIVKAVRGARGGYVLARSPDKITVSEILSAAGESYAEAATRAPAKPAHLRQVDALLAKTKEIRSSMLAHITLADILEGRASSHPLIQKVCAGLRRQQ